MHSDDGYSASDALHSITALSKRISRLEDKFAPEPERDHGLEDKVRYLASKCEQLVSSNATLRDRLEVSQNRTLKVLKFLKIERRRVETRRETIRNLENSQRGLRQRVERIGETNKILLERKQEIEREKERLSNEATRQEGCSPSFHEELRQRNATIQNQRKALAELNSAYNEALNDLRKLRSTVAHLRGQVRQGEAAVNAAFIAPALKEMVGGLSAEELHDELKKTQEELHEARTSRDYWRNIGREQAEQLRGVDGKLKAAEEHATEAESKIDHVRRCTENAVMEAHTKIAYIRNVIRP